MTRKFIIVIIAFAAAMCTKGQKVDLCDCNSLYSKIAEPELIGDLFVEKSKGPVSSYFIDDWCNGTILLSDSMTVQCKYLRYNGFIDRLIYLTKDLQLVQLDKEMVEGFNLHYTKNDKGTADGFSSNYIGTHKNYQFRKIKIKEVFVMDSTIVYAQVLYENIISLFVYRKVVLAKSREEKIYEVFEKDPSYYFKFQEGKLACVKHINKRNIAKILPGGMEQLKNIQAGGKQHRLKTEEDLIQLAKLMDDGFNSKNEIIKSEKK